MGNACVAEPTLHARTPLQGHRSRIGDTALVEVQNLDIVSLAVPLQTDPEVRNELVSQVEQALRLSLPAVGHVYRESDSLAVLGMQPDCWYLVCAAHLGNTETAIKRALGAQAYLTDLSDSWAVLDIDGPDAIAALERLCPLDLAPTSFDDKRVARTAMEHLSVIIERPALQRFRLYSPRSSAHSFLHSVSVSLDNVSNLSPGSPFPP
jgi:sarcosine oxidase subunit gamma